MIQAVIFDMDNTLIDSIKMSRRSYSKVLAELGKKLDPDDIEISQYIIHFEEHKNWEIIIPKYEIKVSLQNLMHRRNEIYEDILRNQIILRPGIEKLLELLKERNIKMAIGSNSNLNHIYAVLDGMGKKHYFSAISSAETLPKKPAPDIFLDAAKQMGIHPNECLVIEDAELGIEAGKNAGMRVIAVPNIISKKQEDMSKADLELETLEKFDLSVIASL